MPGPPPIPNVIKLLRGNPGKRRIADEPKPQISETVPTAPDFLQGYSCDEWYRVAPELHVLGLLTVLDVMPLAAYCEAYKHWRTATETYTAMAARDSATRGMLVKRADGNAGQNPLVGIARRAGDDMVALAGHFGMSPVARARISAGVGFEPPPGSKFDGLLG